MRYFLFWILNLTTLFAQDQIQPYKDYDTDWLSPQFHRGRREALAQKMKPHSIAVLFSSEERLRSNDTYYQYKPESNFYYLTGFTEPEAVLVLLVTANSTRSIVYCREKNLEREIWDGYR
ncbi:MAG TPA: aminopeptidase P N-terminal domain-containing protein, partial [bacterium]|nr:aminopeptidase P N-terminal domain-containing protein [bacterium]